MDYDHRKLGGLVGCGVFLYGCHWVGVVGGGGRGAVRGVCEGSEGGVLWGGGGVWLRVWGAEVGGGREEGRERDGR